MSQAIQSLAEITEIERAYALGAPTLGHAAAALLARWRLPLRDEETFLRLWFLSWYEENEPDWLTGLDETMPSAVALLDEHGGENALTPETRFTIAYLWGFRAPLGASESEYREKALTWARRAAAEEPTSRVFREASFFLEETDDTIGTTTDIEREIHARFDGRGAMGEYLTHMLTTRLKMAGKNLAAG